MQFKFLIELQYSNNMNSTVVIAHTSWPEVKHPQIRLEADKVFIAFPVVVVRRSW